MIKIKNPKDAQPGDLVTFFLDEQFTTRVIQDVLDMRSMLITAPLETQYGVTTKELLVKFEDVYEILRGDFKGKPEPEPEPEPEPAPKPKRKRKKPKPRPVRFPGDALRPGDPGYRPPK